MKAFRKAGLNVFREVAGAVYVSIGGGYASNGTSMHAVRGADELARQLRTLETQARAEKPRLRDALSARGPAIEEPMRVALIRDEKANVFASKAPTCASMLDALSFSAAEEASEQARMTTRFLVS